jgi:hypothetical protein
VAVRYFVGDIEVTKQEYFALKEQQKAEDRAFAETKPEGTCKAQYRCTNKATRIYHNPEGADHPCCDDCWGYWIEMCLVYDRAEYEYWTKSTKL